MGKENNKKVSGKVFGTVLTVLLAAALALFVFVVMNY